MEKGYEILFIMPENRRHKGILVSKRIKELAQKLGVRRMTTRTDAEGTGMSGRPHSAHFFELADRPIEIMFVVGQSLGDQLLDAVRSEGLKVFCIRKPVEFGDLS